VWRDAGGVAHVHEARCPHQFNHLAAVGAVDGHELVCAAHFWRFTAAGTGFRLLTDGTCEAMRDLRRFPAAERDGWVEADRPGAPPP
jgi:nitrite reductase/ring-hydroxylating ferredoxin subunit